MGLKKAAKSIIKSTFHKEMIATKVTKVTVNTEERQHMIEEAAYFRAQHRAFQGENHPLQDWLEAEVEIDHILAP